MRRTATVNIADVIADVLKEYGIDRKLKEARIIAAWHEVLGPLAKPADELYIKNGILFVGLSSSVIRSELSMMRSQMVLRLNEKVGSRVITDIVFR
jgi:predicted nucleic acid-binding Zn ribbon protein